MTKTFEITAHDKTFAVDVQYSQSASRDDRAAALATFIENFLRDEDKTTVDAMAADIDSPTSMQTAEKMFAAMPSNLEMEFGVRAL